MGIVAESILLKDQIAQIMDSICFILLEKVLCEALQDLHYSGPTII